MLFFFTESKLPAAPKKAAAYSNRAANIEKKECYIYGT